jgi:predicted CXXCH cytochrome family protein
MRFRIRRDYKSAMHYPSVTALVSDIPRHGATPTRTAGLSIRKNHVREARRPARTFVLIAAALVTAVSLAGCASDRVVFRDRGPFNPPPDAASGFLGYFDASTKQTTCGNCHVDFQASWSVTKHANAYNAVTTSSVKTPECYSCHSLTGNGNAASGTVAGHDKVADSAYFDVQCESCHGAGLQHVEGVGQGMLIRPLAKLSMAGTGNCGDCHSGMHQPFVEEWRLSRHSNINPSRVANADCAGCHEGRKALERWGFDVNFVEKANPTDYQPVAACGVCHDPHGSGNPSQLRYPVTSQDPDQNLCMKCHNRRSEPEIGTSSPHAPQGAMLLGFAGYRPPGFVYDTARIYGSHATTQNPKLCAGCHIAKFTVTDAATGAFTFQATGHLMRPIPCLDAAGKPTADKTCAYTTAARSWQTCAASGCHANADVAASAFTTVRARMKFFADQLWIDSNGNGSLQASPTDAGLLPQVRASRPTEWSNTDLVITPAEGAEFNARLCGEFGQSNADNSKGVHNPFLCEALMIATINYIRTYYALPAASPSVQAGMSGPIGGEFNHSMHVSRTPRVGEPIPQ